ncbi:MAG: GNAT family N-acetyltransferase, partial [Methanocorpusculum sp.]|nr:GNAT family N-acetyltransferase [Methanocorpusculum sp.]
ETGTNKIVGYLMGGIHSDDENTGKLIRIGVTDGYQRIGCGAKLTSALFDEMKKSGVKKVHLTVAEDNFPAISFYKKIGFAEKKRVEKYFYPNVPRLIFEKEI